MTLVGLLGENTNVAKGCPARSGRRPQTGRAALPRSHGDRIIPEEMTFIQDIISPLEANRTVSVLLKQYRNILRPCGYWGFQDRFRAHPRTFLSRNSGHSSGYVLEEAMLIMTTMSSSSRTVTFYLGARACLDASAISLPAI